MAPAIQVEALDKAYNNKQARLQKIIKIIEAIYLNLKTERKQQIKTATDLINKQERQL